VIGKYCEELATQVKRKHLMKNLALVTEVQPGNEKIVFGWNIAFK
jgi:hypothetical protein